MAVGVPFMSFSMVAELFGVSVATVRRWVRSGALPAVKFGARCVRFRPSDVAAYIDQAARAGRFSRP